MHRKYTDADTNTAAPAEIAATPVHRNLNRLMTINGSPSSSKNVTATFFDSCEKRGPGV